MRRARASIAYLSPPMEFALRKRRILRLRQRRLDSTPHISVRWRYRREEQSSRDRQLHGGEATHPRQYGRRGNENNAAGDCGERTKKLMIPVLSRESGHRKMVWIEPVYPRIFGNSTRAIYRIRYLFAYIALPPVTTILCNKTPYIRAFCYKV